jgi:hypothetical protein
VNYANGLLRKAGFKNLQRQRTGPVMAAKLTLAGAVKFSGLRGKSAKPYMVDFAVDPASPGGYRDIPAYTLRK